MLNFHLTVPLKVITPHIQSVLNILDTNLIDYLGEEAYKAYIEIKEKQKREERTSKSKKKH